MVPDVSAEDCGVHLAVGLRSVVAEAGHCELDVQAGTEAAGTLENVGRVLAEQPECFVSS